MPSDDGQILRNLQSDPMTAADFRRIALSLEGVEEYSHAGLPAFRVGGRKIASLASQAGGYGNLMLTLEQQAAFVEEAPEIFLRSEEHTSELQSRLHLVCRLLLEKKHA